MTEYIHDDTLTHYGVKGMKWGVRKEHKKTEKQLRRSEKADRCINTGKAFIKKYGPAIAITGVAAAASIATGQAWLTAAAAGAASRTAGSMAGDTILRYNLVRENGSINVHDGNNPWMS